MGFVSNKTNSVTTSARGGFASTAAPSKPAGEFDLTTAQGLADFARQAGLEEQVNKILDDTSKLSVLQRLGKGLGAFNPAEAILTGREEGVFRGLIEYPKNIVTGIASAISGRDYEKDRRFFSDVVEEFGVDNSVAKFGLGVLGDILLDPSTYLGGAIAKGVLKGTRAAADIAFTGLAKTSPQLASKLAEAGSLAKEGFAEAFNATHGVRPEVSTRVASGANIIERQAQELAEKYVSTEWGNLTKAQYEEAASRIAAGKIVEYEIGKGSPAGINAAKEIINGATDPKVQSVIKDQLGKLDEMSKLVGIEDPYTSYFPFIRSDKLQQFVQASRSVRPGSEGWLKTFRNVLGVDEIVTDPVQAYSTRAYQIGKTTAQKKQYSQIIGEFGKSFDDMQRLATAAAEKPLMPLAMYKGEVAPFVVDARKYASAADFRAAVAARGASAVQSFEKTVGMNLDEFYNFALRKSASGPGPRSVDDIITYAREAGFEPLYEKAAAPAEGALKRFYPAEFETLSGTKKMVGVADAAPIGFLPKNEAKFLQNMMGGEQFMVIDKLAKATGFDAVTSLWKAGVTALFIPFHARNWVSGMIQNFETLGIDALRPENVAAGSKLAWAMALGHELPEGAMKVAGKEMKMSEIFKPLYDRFGGKTSSYQADIQILRDNGYVRPLLKKNAKSLFDVDKQAMKEASLQAVKNPLNMKGLHWRAARAMGTYIETAQKSTAYITALKQGKSIPEALKLAETAGFDYSALTPFESKIMRRIIPFYAFSRKNAELQLKTLGTHPERINQIFSIFRNAQGGRDEENLPSYIRESLGINVGELPNGIVRYITSLGTPIEQFTGLVGGNPVLRAISQMNPLIKVPIELGTGKDTFRQKDLKDVYDAKEYASMPKIVQDMLDIQVIQKSVLKKNEQTGKLEKVGERPVYVADPMKLLIARSLFTSRGVTYLNQVFNNDLTKFSSYLSLISGIKVSEIDLEQMQSIEETKKKRSLEDMLTRYGQGAIIKRFYIPKE